MLSYSYRIFFSKETGFFGACPVSDLHRRHFRGFVDVNRHDSGHARLMHGDPQQLMGHLHGDPVVGDEDELQIFRHFPDQVGKARYIRVIQRGIDLIQHTKR